jgi:hypothetical protein
MSESNVTFPFSNLDGILDAPMSVHYPLSADKTSERLQNNIVETSDNAINPTIFKVTPYSHRDLDNTFWEGAPKA